MSMFESQMSFAMASGYSHNRPVLTRSRSHTDPTRSEALPDQDGSVRTSTAKLHSSTRPQHARSKSYLSSTDNKPYSRAALLAAPATAAFEKTAEKLPRLHLPGSSHRHHHHSHSHSTQNNASGKTESYRRHRSTQSEAHPRKHDPKSDKDRSTHSVLPHLVAGLSAERERRSQATLSYTNHHHHHNATTPPPHSALQRNFGPSDSNYADYIDGGRYDLRRRATSDSHRAQLAPKTSFEILLERGDQARFAKRLHVKRDDIVRRDAELADAEEEMRTRVNEITTTGVEITRRLDYGYYNLLEKVNNLISTINSFQSLSKQTGQLTHNFDKETHRLDTDIRHRVDVFQETFAARDKRATSLEERGKVAAARAEDLSLRLENARTILRNWEQREASTRRAWGRMTTIFWSTLLAVTLLFFTLLLAREWYFRGDVVKAGLGLPVGGHWNESLRLDPASDAARMLRDSPAVPDEVKNLLLGIAERNRGGKISIPTLPPQIPYDDLEHEGAQAPEDPRLRVFDEL